MKPISVILLATGLILASSCSRAAHSTNDRDQERVTLTAVEPKPQGASQPALGFTDSSATDGAVREEKAAARGGGGGGGRAEPSASDAKLDGGPMTPDDRKIIRNATVALEVQAPLDAQQKIGRIAEQHGGFVVTTEAKQSGPKPGGGPADLTVSITVRVPSTQFSTVLTEVDGIATKVESEKVTGQDVTEEFVDIEARIRAKKALEAQFLEIMKQAHKVEDALEVQIQIADVRGEIERYEGRKRYLENQSSLSTISITLQEPPSAPVITAKWGITDSIKQAGSDAVETAAAILNTAIRFTGFLIPILALIAFPIWLLVRLFRAGIRIRKKAIQVADGH